MREWEREGGEGVSSRRGMGSGLGEVAGEMDCGERDRRSEGDFK